MRSLFSAMLRLLSLSSLPKANSSNIPPTLGKGIISVPTYYTKLTATYMKTLPVHVLINRSDAKPFNFFV
uniref:Uncharacterized protein n=1 Tax=Brassica oleracea var. oleracea TaxID=109376 RepID=A0A0D2ZTS8_BRAOL